MTFKYRKSNVHITIMQIHIILLQSMFFQIQFSDLSQFANSTLAIATKWRKIKKRLLNLISNSILIFNFILNAKCNYGLHFEPWTQIQCIALWLCQKTNSYFDQGYVQGEAFCLLFCDFWATSAGWKFNWHCSTTLKHHAS